MKRVLVTGIGRSGTGYMAALLTAAGMPCGHERLYNSSSRSAPAWAEAVAESSWFAAPWLGALPEPRSEMLVVHVVRHPLAWLGSWVHTVWPHPRRRTAAFLERALPWSQVHEQSTLPDWASAARVDPIDAAMRLWIAWNSLVEREADLLVPVEDVGVEALATIARFPGLPSVVHDLHAALAGVPSNVNARMHEPIAWQQCEGAPTAPAFVRAAERYGYALEEA